MGAITGTPQTVFLSGYSSLEEMSEVHDHDEATMGEKLASLDEEHSRTLAGSGHRDLAAASGAVAIQVA